ncbi:MAG: S41 family peptidase [Candidatus Poribacteria bacterium]|nr:S41 family peptidase [Candidatus Poribacteria bacterium]
MKLLTIRPGNLQTSAKISFHILLSIFLVCMCLPLSWSSEETGEESDDKVLEHLALFSEILGHVKQYHLDTPDSQEIIEGAIKGMLRELDPYSQFMPDYLRFQTQNQGNYGGLGMVIGFREDMLTVITPFKGTPAALAGVQNGDIISQIEGESTAPLSLNDAVDQLRGEPGTSVSITIIRENESRPIELTITRDVIRVPSVEQDIIGDNVGYIKINQFLQTTANDVDNALAEFKAKNVRGVILDLRSNPGGLLSSAVDIASDFLTPGQLVVYSQGLESREDFPAKGIKRENFPLIVLVDDGSASASEIVAGAIKDHGRGLVMGDKTFGKASVQRVFQLRNSKAAVKLTVARYYTPNGVDIDKIGIIPDVESAGFSRSEKQMLESKLQNHEKLKTFIEENGDDVLEKLAAAEHAARDDLQAAKQRRSYQRLSDALAEEQIVLSDFGIKFALARITETSRDELVHDPQIVAAMDQLKVLELFGNKN